MSARRVIKASRGNTRQRPGRGQRPDLDQRPCSSVPQESLRRIKQRKFARGLGSNKLGVSGSHTATGKLLWPMDTHLELSIPPIWYEIHSPHRDGTLKGLPCPAPNGHHRPNDSHRLGLYTNGARQASTSQPSNPALGPDEYRVKGAGPRRKSSRTPRLFPWRSYASKASRRHLKVKRHSDRPSRSSRGDKAFASALECDANQVASPKQLQLARERSATGKNFERR